MPLLSSFCPVMELPGPWSPPCYHRRDKNHCFCRRSFTFIIGCLPSIIELVVLLVGSDGQGQDIYILDAFRGINIKYSSVVRHRAVIVPKIPLTLTLLPQGAREYDKFPSLEGRGQRGG